MPSAWVAADARDRRNPGSERLAQFVKPVMLRRRIFDDRIAKYYPFGGHRDRIGVADCRRLRRFAAFGRSDLCQQRASAVEIALYIALQKACQNRAATTAAPDRAAFEMPRGMTSRGDQTGGCDAARRHHGP